MMAGFIPPLFLFLLFYRSHGANPFIPIDFVFSNILRMFSFLHTNNPFQNRFSVIWIFLFLVVIVGVIFYCHRISDNKCRPTLNIFYRIFNLSELPLYALLLVYFMGIYLMSFGIPDFWDNLIKLLTFGSPHFNQVNIFRICTIPFSILFVPLSILISRFENRLYIKTFTVGMVILLVFLNAPVGTFYKGYDVIPQSYFEPSIWLKDHWNDGAIVVDNQFMIYQLTAVRDIPVEKILGSYWASDLANMEEKNASFIIFTSLPWDGANILFNQIADERFQLVYTDTVSDIMRPYLSNTLNIYEIKW